MKTTDLAPEQLRARIAELLTYDPATGEFRWKLSRGLGRPGRIAGHVAASGYRTIGIDGVVLLAHRLAYLMTHGTLPAMVDHADGNRSNNAIVNLRAATHSTNAANKKLPRHNTSGFKGVSWVERLGKYRAAIKVCGRTISLGHHLRAEEAASAYADAARTHFGEYARA
jgi:hypothetical protein